ncbi:hypothetical protein B0H14DRAFT_371008 [Mycena olivaceomarginata]|nr:hypothetical protein B0H14DRAFT_371008 [Mycena olivaceomarginata]
MCELMRAYAIVALGLLGDSPFPSRAVVVFHLEMFSSTNNARRLGIRRIQVLPLLALGDVVIGRYESTCREMMEDNPGLIPLCCMICPNIGQAKDNYASYDVAAVFPARTAEDEAAWIRGASEQSDFRASSIEDGSEEYFLGHR